MGDNEAEVLKKTKNPIKVMGRASFAVKKITSDSKRLIESFEKESRHPIMNAILEEQDGGRSEKVLSQLGLKYAVNLNENCSFIVFDHWRKGLRFDKRGFTKRNMLSAVATCWSPLNEVGPLLISVKLAISNLWKLQKFLAEKLKLAKEDLRP